MAIRRIALATTAAVIFLGANASAASTKATVRLKDIKVSPTTVVIARGGTVTWRFLDGVAPHNVTSTGRPGFRSSPTKQSGTYTHRFTRKGTYAYRCTIHPNMRGRVVVR